MKKSLFPLVSLSYLLAVLTPHLRGGEVQIATNVAPDLKLIALAPVVAPSTNAVVVSTSELPPTLEGLTFENLDLSSVSPRSVSFLLKELERPSDWYWAPISNWSLESTVTTAPHACAYKVAYYPFWTAGRMSLGVSIDTRETPRIVDPEQDEGRIGLRLKIKGKKSPSIARR